MKRGDIFTAAQRGDYGKPRPVLVIQTDRLSTLDSVIICPFTSAMEETAPLRVRVEPSDVNGLKVCSDVMTDKIGAVSRLRCKEHIGTIEPDALMLVEQRLLFVLGLAD